MPEEQIGKIILAGFKGQNVSPNSHAHKLISIHRVQAFIIKPHNYNSGKQLKRLIKDLQHLALYHNYSHPLIIAIDQELGALNAFYEDLMLCQFPTAMALAATDDLYLIKEVGKAIALQLRSIGINMYLGPILDICTKQSNMIGGVHTFGTTPEQVIKYAGAFTSGLKEGGILTCAKNFPGIGKAIVEDVFGAPSVNDTEQQILSTSILPFKGIISQNLIDAVSVANTAFPNVSTNDYLAFMSPQIVDGMLRDKLQFNGVIISGCLEMDLVYTTWGVGQAAALAIIYAGCDMITICESYENQCEAFKYLKIAFSDEGKELVLSTCMSRIDTLLNQISYSEDESELEPSILSSHKALSEYSYSRSVTIVRDFDNILPLTNYIMKKRKEYQTIKNFTPNLPPYKFIKIGVLTPLVKDLNMYASHNYISMNESELDVVFKEFINYLAGYSMMHTYQVTQVEYSKNGLTTEQESIISNSDLLILVITDCYKNPNQLGIVKKLAIIVEHLRDKITSVSKQLIILSAGSPFQIKSSAPIGSTLICSYDYTFPAFRSICELLFGDSKVSGKVLGIDDNKVKEKSITGVLSFNNSKNNVNNIWNLNGLLNTTQSNVQDVIFAYPDQILGNAQEVSYINGNGEPQTNGSNNYSNSKVRAWVVESFDFDKDILSVYAMAKDNNIPELVDQFSDETLSRLRELFQDCQDRMTIFVVRNSSTGVAYGLMVTYYDPVSKIGSYIYLVVSKWKRGHQIGKALHNHALKYFTIEKKCTTIALGTAFPLNVIFSASIISELSAIKKLMNYNSEGKELETMTNSIQFVQFFRANGWGVSKFGFEHHERLIMKLNILENWELPGKKQIDIYEGEMTPPSLIFYSPADFMSSLKESNITFRLSDTLEPINEILKTHYAEGSISDDEMARFPEMYEFAEKFIGREKLDLNSPRHTMILCAYVNNTPVGSCIVYNKCSSLSNFYYFIDNVGIEKENACGITGLMVSHANSLQTLSSTLKSNASLITLGLITSAVQIIKTLSIDQVILHNVSKEHQSVYASLGFKPYRIYCAVYAKKKSFEWLL